MIKNYVKYIDEVENTYINSLEVYNPTIFILTTSESRQKVSPISNNGRWPSRFKYVKSINDLYSCLSPNEELIIEITPDNIEKVNANNLFSITFPEKQEKIGIGEKAYLVDYDFSFNGLPKEIAKEFTPVVALKRSEEGIYSIGNVGTITDSIKERREEIQNGFGEFSDLYHKTTNPLIAEQFADDIIEFTQIGPKKWMISKIPSYKKDSINK